MSKRALIVVILSGALFLCSCGVDKEVKAVIDAIDALGEIEVSDIEGIEQAQSLYDALTEEQKGQVSNYATLEEAQKQLPQLKKQYAIENDKTAPTFTGLEDGTVIDVKGGSEFNLSKYLTGKLSIIDDVTEGPIKYRTDCESEAYDSITGKFDTQSVGQYPVKLVATDEAGNEAVFSLTVSISPIHVTKDDPTPVVYDGEYGVVKVVGFTHDSSYGQPEYHLILEVENKTDKSIEVALASPYTTINKYQVGAYTVVNSIPSGTIGKMESLIDDANIPNEVGNYSTIESKVSFYEAGNDDAFYRIPIVLDVNVSQ
ncbi:MAG: hypothetical protein IJI12_05775 [Atopobiaceae bacterium]|nr:hypothetical protein [Atopobiaceae bacterium]